jgi:dihydrofolate reductase
MSTRRVRLSVAMSLDGFIAGPNGEYDWIPMDPEIDFAELFREFDTILMGRKSYELARRDGHLGAQGLRTLVFSSSLEPAAHPEVTIVRDPAETVRRLRSEPGKDLWLWGGGELFRSFLERRLVDEIEIAVVPILLGSGLPLLPGGALRTPLVLRSHRLFRATGTVLYRYAVEGAALGSTP